MAKRKVYVTSLDCSCGTRLLRINAWPQKPPPHLSPALIRARYSVLYCVDCDGDLAAASPRHQRSS